MFPIIITSLVILATILLIVTWIFFVKKSRKLFSLLIFPYALYFFFMLLGKEELGTYINDQFFTVSIAFFAIYSCLLLFFLGKITNLQVGK